MTRIIAGISVSLDGFVARPGPGPDNGLGAGGEAGKPAFVAANRDHSIDRGAPDLRRLPVT
jgi:hypothetical protein